MVRVEVQSKSDEDEEKVRENVEDENELGCEDLTKLPHALWMKCPNCPWCCICVQYFVFSYHFSLF